MGGLNFDFDNTEWADRPKREPVQIDDRHTDSKSVKKIMKTATDNRRIIAIIQAIVTVVFSLALIGAIALLFIWGFRVAFGI